LNIEGKRSGEGFVAHKATLVNALSRALADRVILMDLTIGRKGFLGYLKALGGSNIVKVIPSNGSASGERTIGKQIKVICGANTSYLADMKWIGDKTPFTLCDIRVSPSSSVKPNVGTNELAEALNRVLPFTATDDTRPVLQCVNFIAKDGKLTLVSADGFRLAIVSLDYDDGEYQALVSRDDLKGIASALRRAKRARVSFEPGGETLDGTKLIIDTESVRYQWTSVNGTYPEYEKLIPTEFSTFAHLDTIEAIKAVNALKAIADDPKDAAIDLTIGDGKIVLASPDDTGQAELTADTEGQGKIRVNGAYLTQVLKACGGMVDFKLTNGYSPMLFSQNGFQVVVMPIMSNEANDRAKADREAKQAETAKKTETAESTKFRVVKGIAYEVDPIDPTEQADQAEAIRQAEEVISQAETIEPVAEAITEGKAEAEPATEPEPIERKPKRSRKRDKVAVA
jgi:DNA polymerase-3 subunit beta